MAVALDCAYLMSKGANILQAIAWCARHPSGNSLIEDMDDYLKGSEW